VEDFTDDSGWSYAIDFTSKFHKKRGIFDLVRRRKWFRYCSKIETKEEENKSKPASPLLKK